MLEQGCYNAIHLDGGGSTTMVINDGGLKVANSPSDGAQRSLANGILLVPYDGEPDIVKDSFNTLPDTPSADNSDTGVTVRSERKPERTGRKSRVFRRKCGHTVPAGFCRTNRAADRRRHRSH